MAEPTIEDRAEVQASFAFVDLAGFTALTEVHGDGQAAALVSRFIQLAVQACRGSTRVVKSIGDAVMLVADTPEDAVGTVVLLARFCAAERQHPVVRAGVHHGPAVRLGEDYIGTTVNVAARLAAAAGAGQLLTVADYAAVLTRHGLATRLLPGRELRHVSGTFDLIEADLDDAMASTVIDPVCRMRVDPAHAAAWVRDGEGTSWFCSEDCASRFLAGRRHT